MDTAGKEQFLDGFFTEFGTTLQAVAYYDLDEYDIWFLREDVARLYSTADVERIWEAVSFEKTVESAETELYHDDIGTYRATVRVFERALVTSIRLGESSGLYVALDRGADPTLSSLVDVVTSASRYERGDRGCIDDVLSTDSPDGDSAHDLFDHASSADSPEDASSSDSPEDASTKSFSRAR